MLFTRNFKDVTQLKNLVSEIQYFAIQHGKPEGMPIFADQEGGFVQRFGRGFTTPLPCPEVFGTTYNINPEVGLELAKQYGKRMAESLLPLGILSLAPVIDLKAGNSVIEGLGRAFHQDPYICAALAKAYIDGMNAVGMPAIGKHFPGHGQNIGDSHVTSPTDDRTLDIIEAQDLVPFRTLIRQNKLAAIMPAHITYPKIDPDNTAGMSRIWLEELLRKKYGFYGIIISDCLSMQGAGTEDNIGKTKKALEYGDIALLCNLEPADFLAVLKNIDINQYKNDEIARRYSNLVDGMKEVRLQIANNFAKTVKPVIFSNGAAQVKKISLSSTLVSQKCATPDF